MTGPHHFREDAGATHLDSALTTTDSSKSTAPSRRPRSQVVTPRSGFPMNTRNTHRSVDGELQRAPPRGCPGSRCWRRSSAGTCPGRTHAAARPRPAASSPAATAASSPSRRLPDGRLLHGRPRWWAASAAAVVSEAPGPRPAAPWSARRPPAARAGIFPRVLQDESGGRGSTLAGTAVTVGTDTALGGEPRNLVCAHAPGPAAGGDVLDKIRQERAPQP